MPFLDFLKSCYEYCKECVNKVLNWFYQPQLENGMHTNATSTETKTKQPRQQNGMHTNATSTETKTIKHVEPDKRFHDINRKPVRPTKSKCGFQTGDNPCTARACVLCVICETHFCIEHCGPDDPLCPYCLTNEIRQYFNKCFQEKCSVPEPNLNCYLSPCKHLYHRECLEDWCEDIGGGLCWYCPETFRIEDIKNDFALPPRRK
jgi:hypothetical protein